MSEKKEKNNDIKNVLKNNNNEKKNNLFDSIINHNISKSQNKNYNKIHIKKNNSKSLVEQIIDDNKNNIIKNRNEKNKQLNKNYNSILHKSSINSNINTLNKNYTLKNFKLKINPFVTSVDFKNIQTNEEESKIVSPKYKSKKNNLVCFGKSLNQILINNIKDAIMKKGNIINKKKRKNYSANIYNKNDNLKNYNNYEMHMKIFDDKLIEMYENYQKKQKLYKKQRLYRLSPDLEEKRRIANSRIPLYIKGYKKSDVDIVYTRNVCDLDYQKYYMKDKINMNQILENHNIYNRKDYLSGKIPFFMLTKTVVKPVCRKTFSQKNIFGNNYKEISI